MKKLPLILFLVIALCFPVMAADFDLILQWDENTEPDLATGELPRYKIYYKTDNSGNGLKTNYIGLPNVEIDKADEGASPVGVTIGMDEYSGPEYTQFTLHNLNSLKDYFFSVTALDQSGNESDLSDEVQFKAEYIDDDVPAKVTLPDIIIIQYINPNGQLIRQEINTLTDEVRTLKTPVTTGDR